jgi:acyl-CoA-binding protein
MVAQSAEFKKAIEDSRSLSKTPSNDELLEVRTSRRRA